MIDVAICVLALLVMVAFVILSVMAWSGVL